MKTKKYKAKKYKTKKYKTKKYKAKKYKTKKYKTKKYKTKKYKTKKYKTKKNKARGRHRDICQKIIIPNYEIIKNDPKFIEYKQIEKQHRDCIIHGEHIDEKPAFITRNKIPTDSKQQPFNLNDENKKKYIFEPKKILKNS